MGRGEGGSENPQNWLTKYVDSPISISIFLKKSKYRPPLTKQCEAGEGRAEARGGTDASVTAGLQPPHITRAQCICPSRKMYFLKCISNTVFVTIAINVLVLMLCSQLDSSFPHITVALIFIGPRYTWGPIYGSESL